MQIVKTLVYDLEPEAEDMFSLFWRVVQSLAYLGSCNNLLLQ